MSEEPLNPKNYQTRKPAHPMVKWIVALIIGLLGSLLLMTFLVMRLVEETGGIGGDLVFNNFFVYTGGFVLIQNMNGSIVMFLLATGYYFLFFTFIGLIIGYIIEWLTKVVRQN